MCYAAIYVLWAVIRDVLYFPCGSRIESVERAWARC